MICYRFQIYKIKLLDIVDFFEILDNLLLTHESTISRFHCTAKHLKFKSYCGPLIADAGVTKRLIFFNG